MSFDGIVTRAAVTEIHAHCAGGRINRVHQPEPSMLRLDIHNHGTTKKLLLDIAGNTPYAYFAQTVLENPDRPPQFCMVLRKHLQNGRVHAVLQAGMDRVLRLEVDTRDELGIACRRTLVCELMGKYSNLFLLDENDRIIEPLKRISGDLSRVRPVYPGLTYRRIPSEKTNLLDALILPETGTEEGTRIQKWLLNTYEGFGPPVTRELCFQAGIDAAHPVSALRERDLCRLKEALGALRERLAKGEYAPSVMGEYAAFYAFPLLHLGEEIRAYPDMSACAEAFRTGKRRAEPSDSLLHGLRQSVATRLERTRVKYEKMKKEYDESLDRDKDLLYADLLSANAHRAERGASEVTVTNYFDEDMSELSIPLDPRKDVWQNAQQYYKSFSKRKNRERVLAGMLPGVRADISFLRQVLQDLEMAATREELQEIRDGLIEEGLLAPRGRRRKTRTSEPLQFRSSDGYTIYVGKNSRQNDQLTMRTAGRDDWFFHAKDVPGSHVIVRAGREALPETTKLEAAWLAAGHSSEKNETHVLVDFTRKKNVRKQKGAKPGQVFYEPYETLTVDLANPKTRPEPVQGESDAKN